MLLAKQAAPQEKIVWMHEETSGFRPLQTKNTCTQPDNAFRNTTQIYFNCQRANLQRGLNFSL